MILVVSCFEIQLVVKCFEIQVIWLSTGLGFKLVGDFPFCEASFKNEALNSKAKLFCETSFKNEAWRLKNV